MPDRYEPNPDSVVLDRQLTHICISIDGIVENLRNFREERRRYALLQAAAVILAGDIAAQTRTLKGCDEALEDALYLLAEIERREK